MNVVYNSLVKKIKIQKKKYSCPRLTVVEQINIDDLITLHIYRLCVTTPKGCILCKAVNMCVISINIFVLNSFLFIQLFYHKSSEGVNHVFLVGIECTKSPGFEAGLGIT